MKRPLVISLVLVTSVVLVGIWSVANRSVAQQQKNLDQVMAGIGQFVRSHHEVFANGLKMPSDVPSEKAVAWINGLPISYEELQLRWELDRQAGLGSQKPEDTLKKLVREKAIMKEAISLGLMATEKEVEEYILKEKETAKQDPEFRALIGKIITAWGITEEEYWNVYERYNATRLLTLDKLSRHVLKDFYGREMVTPDDEMRAKEHWDKYVEELLSRADVKLNPQLNSLGP